MAIKFEQLVKEELARARQNHGPQNSYHEGYAVLLEEVDELWEEVKKKTSNRNHLESLMELVQIASCAQKMAEDVVIPLINGKENDKTKNIRSNKNAKRP